MAGPGRENLQLGWSSAPTPLISLSLSFGFALGSILTAWFRGWFLSVIDLRRFVIGKRLSLYVNYAVTFSIHKVYIPINIIHIYYI